MPSQSTPVEVNGGGGDRHLPSRPTGGGGDGRRELAEVLAGNSLVEANPRDGYILVTPKGTVKAFKEMPTREDFSQLGSSGGSNFISFHREEYNAELRGINGIRTYDKMKRGDGTTRKSLRLIKTPVLAARWYMQAAQAGQDEESRPIDELRAQFMWDCLTKHMSISWHQVLTEALLMLDYGHMVFEKVFELRVIDGVERAVWKKLMPIHPMDILDWDYDFQGGLQAVQVSLPESPWQRWIGIDKLLVFSFDKEGGNARGISILRSAYKHWYMKDQLYKIDAIQKERHGIGIPVIHLPPGYNDDDKAFAQELGRNLRTNEKAHVVLPPNWEIEFAKIEGQTVDALESASHHDDQIMSNVMGDFLNGSSGGETGVENQWQIFQKATAFIAEIVRDVFNKYAIPQLYSYNWGGTDYPILRARRIGDTTDWRTLSFAIRNFIGSKVIRPDDRLEEWIRDELDAPPVDLDTVRETPSPQAPGQADNPGAPRQTPTPPVGPPAPQGGTDQSGG